MGLSGQNPNCLGIYKFIPFFPNAYGMTEMNINSRLLGGKSLSEIDKMIAETSINLPQNLTEAVVHECGHAKAYRGRKINEIKEMNKTLAEKHIGGISTIAEIDGAECIAEIEVLLYRGQTVPDEAMQLYQEYVKGAKK